MSRTMLFVAAVPALVLTIARAAFLVLSVFDLHPFWMRESLNLAEAAAMRDRGEVARLLAEGQDPNGTYLVRRGFVHDNAVELTPMQAAIAARREEIVQILVDAGAKAEPPEPAGQR